MKTEIVDQLYLELSQFTTAKTARELQLEEALRRLLDCGNDGMIVLSTDWDIVRNAQSLLIPSHSYRRGEGDAI